MGEHAQTGLEDPAPGHSGAGPAGETGLADVLRVLERRVSVRRYDGRPVADALVERVLRAAFRAPTSSNIQACSVVVVRERRTLQALSEATGGQRHVAETPVFLAFCADLTRIENALVRHGFTCEGNNLEMGLVSTIDAALVGMSASLAAETLGLRGVMIGAVRNDPLRVAELLGLPRRVYCVFGMCLGWPAESPPQKPRMPFEMMVHPERYDPARSLSRLDEYDRALARHYREAGRPTTDDSWTHDIAARFSTRPRDGLRAALRALGFDFL